MEQPTLEINDVSLILQAVQVAQKRGVFEFQESGQLAEPVERLSSWIKMVSAIQEHAKETETKTEENLKKPKKLEKNEK